ncbi:MAG: hypothetical protein Wins2KO_29990 [Winogradskyella sp.]
MYSNLDLLILLIFNVIKFEVQILGFFLFGQKNEGLLGEMLSIVVDNPNFCRVNISLFENIVFLT